MRWVKRIWFILKLHKSIPFLFGFFLSREIKLATKLLFSGLIIGYVLFPMDVIPDYLLVLGIVDDITVAIFILQLMVKIAPEPLKEKYNF